MDNKTCLYCNALLVLAYWAELVAVPRRCFPPNVFCVPVRTQSQGGTIILIRRHWTFDIRDFRFSRQWGWRCFCFWVVTPCRLVGRHQRFGEKYCLHLQGWNGGAGKWRAYIWLEGGQALQRWRWSQYVSLKRWYLPTSLHSVTSQSNNMSFFDIWLAYYCITVFMGKMQRALCSRYMWLM
jgi:hypothetical protein